MNFCSDCFEPIEDVEQNPSEKVEPKFKVGDWVIIDNEVLHIEDVINNEYITEEDGHIPFRCEKEVRLWTIQDAKDGDVLATKAGGIFIYKELLYDKPFAYCGVDKFGVFKDCNCGDGLDWTPYLSEVTPATKKQRDLLFQKMKEAGYEWDADKKELKKIEPTPIIPKFKVGDVIKDIEDGEVFVIKTITKEKYIYTDGSFDWIKDQDVYELVEQKPRMIIWTGNNLKDVIDFTGKDKNFDKWFESFEDYEKFVREHDGILKLFNEDGSHYEVPVGAWIVKTPDGCNVASKAVFKQKPAWSEEDDEMFRLAIEHFEIQKRNSIEGGLRKKSIQEFIDWFKDLKDRVQPQNQWKPSEAMLEALYRAIDKDVMEKSEDEILLDKLYQGLKYGRVLSKN